MKKKIVLFMLAMSVGIAQAATIYCVNIAGEIRTFTGAGDGLNPIEGNTFAGGTLVTTIAAYNSYLGFTQAPDGMIYGVNGAGGVVRWDTLTSWLAGENGTIQSIDAYGAAGIHGCSFNGNGDGYYVVYEGNGMDGDIGEFANLEDFIDNANAFVSASTYGGNILNFYYPDDDSSSLSQYYQVAGSGRLEGFVTLADYIAGPDNLTQHSNASDFSGVIAAFAEVYAGPDAVLPPVDAAAVPSASAEVTLTWSVGQNAQSYTVYRSEESGVYDVPLQTGLSGLSYTDTTVDNYTTYYYRIVSVSDSGESIPSVEVSVIPYDTGDTTPPAAPSNFTGDNPKGVWAELDWDDSVEPDVKSFSVYRSSVSGSYSQPVASNLTESAYTDEDLVVGETYYYVVTATDYAGLESATSLEQSVTAAPLTGEQKVFFVLNSGEIFAFSSMASNGVTCLGQGHVTNGIAVATNPSYGTYQGFSSVPNGRIYGIDAGGDVIEWPDLDSWIGNINSSIASSGNFNSGLNAEVHGVSYDPNAGGYYTIQGSGTYEGDIGEYSDLAALLANAPTTNYTSGFNGNVCNFYYTLEDTPQAAYYQIAGNGTLEGWLTLPNYVSGAKTFTIGGFGSGVTTVGAFSLFANGAVGNVSIAPAGGQLVITAEGTTDGPLYVLQSKGNLVLPLDWIDVSRDLESIGGSVSVTTTPTQGSGFYRISVQSTSSN